MALASAPVTPERSGQPRAIQRSFTAPIKSVRTPSSLTESEAQTAETLFAHASGKIVSFTASSQFVRRHSSIGDAKSEFQDEPVGILPWASITERTIAAGPLQIYRVLGSVAFLNSGKILQPLLAKSQCWCVDGVSKFVLRIRPQTYYRIELPHETQQDENKVEEMKKVMESILQYEKTPCPFKRGFTVELPEPPETPIRKRPWRPKTIAKMEGLDGMDGLDDLEDATEESDSTEPLEGDLQHSRGPEDFGVFRDPNAKQNVAGAASASPSILKGLENVDVDGKSRVEAAVDEIHHKVAQETHEKDLQKELESLKTPTRPISLRTGRTVTAPPHLSLHNPPSSNNVNGVAPSMINPNRNTSTFSSSVESFHSFHSPISPVPLSPHSSSSSPESLASALQNAKSRQHKRDISEVTVTTDKHELWDLTEATPNEEHEFHSLSNASCAASSTTTQESVSRDMDHGFLDAESSEPQVRLRTTRKARVRSTSPLPSSTNLYSPRSPTTNISGRHLTTAILQRTCSLLLGPPVQLVALMLRIAAKITEGVFHGTALGINNDGQQIPCSWDFSDGSGDDDQAAADSNGSEDEDEDDYGVSLGKTVSGKDVRAKDYGGSWEID